MDFFQCIENRRSCRAFSQQEVEKPVLEKIIKAANRSPSTRNSQPWELYVVKGEKRDSLVNKIQESVASGAPPTPDLQSNQEWPEELTKRMEDHFRMRFEATGVDPDDKKQIQEAMSMNMKLYGAPCVMFIGMDRRLGSYPIFDLGLFVQGILLGLEAEGLGACAQASVTRQAGIIHKELEIPDTISLILAISFGYPDCEALTNQYHSKRKDLSDFVRWYGL